ncbi:MAG: FkbM family methyltransferase [Bacteroidetes bacterium]|nr:FkbM family methyltransferase [Bacteroidota bacterium]
MKRSLKFRIKAHFPSSIFSFHCCYIFGIPKSLKILVTSNKIAQQLSISIGNLLFRHFFPVYNIIYPLFKYRQDADEIEFLKRTVKKGDVVLDIGANIGFYSKILSGLVGASGKVYSFEPDKVNFNYFLKNTNSLTNIVPVNKAVADQTKTLKLYTSKLLNVDHRTYKVDEYEKELTIDAVSIDDFVNDVFKVDFIKMDIQGFELTALKGMVKTISLNPDLKIIMELWPHGLQKSGTSFDEFFSFFRTLKLKLYALNGIDLTPYNGSELKHDFSYSKEYYFNILISNK